MSFLSARSALDVFRFLLITALAGIALACIVLTIRWPLVWDAQVFHYTHFLIEHGFAPYRDIPDINMPGVYVLEGWAMHLFGGSDLGWRIYDFALLASLTLAMIAISRPYDWLAGLFAGVTFALVHVNDGPWNSVERDEIMTVLVLIGYAFFFASLRRRKSWYLLGFGLSLGIATTIKPTVAPLGILLLIMAAWRVRKEGRPVGSSLWYGLSGALIAVLISLEFLVRHHALQACIHNIETYTSFYATLDQADIGTLLRFMPKKVELAMLPFALAVALRQKGWNGWERAALLFGVLFGFFSYLQQAKGYDYHRYPVTAFVLLWMSIELALAMREAGWRRWVGAAGFTAGLLVGAPPYLHHVAEFRADSDFVSLQQDLVSLGTDRLQRKVQCMDVVQGCYAALYHLRLVQSSGMIGDILLFSPRKSPAVDGLRDWYWNQLTSNPPVAIVVTNEWFEHYPSFKKLEQWPRLSQYLSDHYNLVIERNVSEHVNSAYRLQQTHHAYRIYLRKEIAVRPPGKSG